MGKKKNQNGKVNDDETQTKCNLWLFLAISVVVLAISAFLVAKTGKFQEEGKIENASAQRGGSDNLIETPKQVKKEKSVAEPVIKEKQKQATEFRHEVEQNFSFKDKKPINLTKTSTPTPQKEYPKAVVNSVGIFALNATNTPPYVHSNITFKVIQLKPKIAIYWDFLTDEEVKFFKAKAEPFFRESSVLVKENTNFSSYNTAIRNSSSASLRGTEDEFVNLRKRICHFIKDCVPGKIEPFQVVHYKKSQFYKPHYDFYYEKVDGEPSPKMLKDPNSFYNNNRQHTFLIYLNDVKREHGGGTCFPRLEQCIQPMKGVALYFENFDENRHFFEEAIHAAKPLTEDVEKWAINVWIREKDMTEGDYLNIREIYKSRRKTDEDEEEEEDGAEESGKDTNN